MKILKLDFKKTTDEINTTSYGNVDLTNQDNLNNIEKYILPVITENEGWGTKHVTVEGFKQNPLQYQEDLDATLFANVTVVLHDNETPLGLLEYLEESIYQPVFQTRMDNIKDLVHTKAKWQPLLEGGVISEKVLDRNFMNLKMYMRDKKIYSEIGIVVRPDLQGKRSGVAELLYKHLSNGIIFGWTSNPLYIAQCRKHFSKTIYFPLLGESINSIEGLAGLAVLYGDLQTYTSDRTEGLDFGVIRSPYFVSNRNDYYLELAKDLVKANKITKLDGERIKYSINKKDAQGAVISFS